MTPANQSAGGEPITAAGIEELKAELAELKGPRRLEMADRIRVARERRDLKAPAEPPRHAGWGGGERGGRTFAFGKTAEVLDESKGETVTWTLVGSTEANLTEGNLSAESPLGPALMAPAR